MSVRITVNLGGLDRLKAALAAMPEELLEAIRKATDQSTALAADAIRGETPERTGRLERSITSTVRVMPAGAEGHISSSLRYARFVEFGTREHGRAQHMFLRGIKASEPAIQGLYRAAVDRVAATLE